MATKRSKGLILFSIIIAIVAIGAVCLTASQIEKDESANGEFPVEALITKAGSVETNYEKHVNEDGVEVYDLLMYQTIELQYSIDNKKYTEKMPNMLVHQQVVDAPLETYIEKEYASQSAYKLGAPVKLYVMESDYTHFRMVESTGALSYGLGITLIVIEVLLAIVLIVLLAKHTMNVMLEFV